MKSLLGHDNLAWDPSQQEGVFQGQAVYDMSSQGFVGQPTRNNGRSPMPQQQHYQATPAPPPMHPPLGHHPQQKPRRAMFAPGTEGPVRGGGWTAVSAPTAAQPHCFSGVAPYGEAEEVEYPLPGSSASCDICGEVVTRFYHCSDCREETGLFDLCTMCCAAAYLQQGPPHLLAKVRSFAHPTHVYATHSMVHVTPTGS